jgi:acyl carrier protein
MVALFEKYVEELTADLTASSAADGTHGAPTTDTERMLAEVLADVSGLERVSVDSHFFDDLGADSMMMARFCARVRKRGDLPPVSMKDIYQHPTISSLAETLTHVLPAAVEPPVSPPAPTAAGNRAARVQYVGCGVLQLEPEVREFLVDVYGADGLPFTTCFGNGDPISRDVVTLLNEVYQANTVREPWQAGDLMLVDNIRCAHSREDFTGPREVLIGLTDPVRLADCSPTLEVAA